MHGETEKKKKKKIDFVTFNILHKGKFHEVNEFR